MSRRPVAALLAAAATGALGAGALVAGPTALAAQASQAAQADQAAQSRVVSAVPASGTPQILNGAVFAVAQVGATMVVGGSFTAATAARGGATLATPYILAFDASTGTIKTAFRPRLDGHVQTLLPGPAAGTVYVGGDFTTAGRQPARSLVLLNMADGSRHAGFAMPAPDGAVHTVERLGNRLFVGGDYTRVGQHLHGGIVTLDATTGAVEPYLTSDVTINHNWTPASPAGNAHAPVGVSKLDISPDGSKLVAIGNFKKVDGTPHDQIAMWDLPRTGHAALRNWRTRALEPACLAKAFDTYARDVHFSPDGSYFGLADTGAYYRRTICDAAARFETAATGQNVQPTWIAYTGGDSLLSVAVTGEAVYVGGHQRWLNNGMGSNRPGPGSVPRPGVAALDPANGMPLAWNPGRNPRGAGTYALYPTATGLWMGSDTKYIGTDTGGHQRYLRPRIAFFPLAGGRPSASKALATLPATAHIGASTRSFNGSTAGPARRTNVPADVAVAHGTTLIGSTVFYTSGSGLFRRSFQGGQWGPAKVADPYDDPVWSGVETGSGGYYRGVKPAFYALIPHLTSMFYDGRSQLYYTVAGKAGLFSRAFSPDSGTIRSQELTAPGVRLPQLSGAFLSGGLLYYVTAADGNLHRAAFLGGGRLGPQHVVSGPSDDGVDWRTRVLFLAPS